MDRETLWKQYEALPSEARKRVDALIAALTGQLMSSSPAGAGTSTPLGDEPFVGLWRGRSEMEESSDWVRSTRRSEWNAPGG
jgi:hypothetical protein